MDAAPFEVRVSDATLTDLRLRLDRARLMPDSPHRPGGHFTVAEPEGMADRVRAFARGIGAR